jgi:hypothetical protein
LLGHARLLINHKEKAEKAFMMSVNAYNARPGVMQHLMRHPSDEKANS